MKKALITGIAGQDGSYLAELLLEKEYQVYGTLLPGEQLPFVPKRKLKLFVGNLADQFFIGEIIKKLLPNEVYNLGAQSNVKKSFEMPEYTAQATGMSVVYLLEAIRLYSPSTRLYQASSCEMFGQSRAPQSESTSFSPMSPYASAKVYAYHCVKNYRQVYDIFACSGILFHHESPRRNPSYVTRKITTSIINIVQGKQNELLLGNIYVRRDWGFAPEYIKLMWLMLQQSEPCDYVIGTGHSYTVKDFVQYAFSYIGVDIAWQGEGLHEVAVVQNNTILPAGCEVVKIHKDFFRALDGTSFRADATKVKSALNWEPRVFLEQLVSIMMDYDLQMNNLPSHGLGKQLCLKMGLSNIFNTLVQKEHCFPESCM